MRGGRHYSDNSGDVPSQDYTRPFANLDRKYLDLLSEVEKEIREKGIDVQIDQAREALREGIPVAEFSQ